MKRFNLHTYHSSFFRQREYSSSSSNNWRTNGGRRTYGFYTVPYNNDLYWKSAAVSWKSARTYVVVVYRWHTLLFRCMYRNVSWAGLSTHRRSLEIERVRRPASEVSSQDRFEFGIWSKKNRCIYHTSGPGKAKSDAEISSLLKKPKNRPRPRRQSFDVWPCKMAGAVIGFFFFFAYAFVPVS
jgi:hypothetical protein